MNFVQFCKWVQREERKAKERRHAIAIGVDLASGPDSTVYACREHINAPHPACPTCAEVARLASPTGDERG